MSLIRLENPDRRFAVVDFPDPFGPMRVTISPRLIEKSTPRTSHLPFRRTPALARLTKGIVSGDRKFNIKKFRLVVATGYRTRYSITQLM